MEEFEGGVEAVGGEINRKSLGDFSFSLLFFSKQRIMAWETKHFRDIIR
jgi:hypothetical protein